MDHAANLSTHERRRSLLRGSLLVCLAGILSAGCVPDSRISLADFLDQQRAMENAAWERLPREDEVIDLKTHLGPYLVGPGDVLDIDLIGADGVQLMPDLLARVDRDGQIALPVIGSLHVTDMELEDVEKVVRGAYVPNVYRDAVCHVEVSSIEPTNVMVIGAVTVPGLVQLRRTERNLLFAIHAAGGASLTASGEVMLRRLRRPREEVTLNLRDPNELRAALSLDALENGDIVTVRAAKPNTIFVGGLVNRPGPQAYAAGTEMNVLQTIAAAVGLRTDVAPKEATLTRRMPDGTDAHVKLDLERIAMGEDPNLMLAAGDILWVPHTFETVVQEFIARNVFMRAGVSFNYSISGFENFNHGGMSQQGLGGGTNIQNAFDPFGALQRNAALQNISVQTQP